VPVSDGVSETAQAPVTANANAAGNGEAADYDVPADKRVSTGVAEPEGGHFEFA